MQVSQLHVGSGFVRGGLTVFPVWTAAVVAGRGYVPAARAGLEIREQAGSPSVGDLVVFNPGTRPALVLDGDLLEGGWQHRVANRSVLVPAQDSLALDVSCVEAGRWGGDITHRTGRRRAPLGVRPALGNLHRPEVPTAGRTDQGEVWRRVGGYEQRHDSSGTHSLLEATARAEESVQGLVADVAPLPGQAGVLLGIGGYPAALELFDSPRTLREVWSALLLGAALDSLSAPAVPTPSRRARRLAEELTASGLQPETHAGLGTTAIGHTEHLATRALLWRDRAVHLFTLDRRHPLALAA